MHIVVMVLGVVAGLGFWWYRIRAAGDAASEVIDAAGRMRGSFRRKRIRNQAELSPLTAINDPIVAAATLLASIASDDVALSPQREAAIREELAGLTEAGKAEEALVYGQWASGQIDEAGTVIDKLGPFLATRLNEGEKHGLVDIARTVVAADGPPLLTASHRLRRLTQKIGLEVH
jgi:hypothetical protein